MDNYSGYIKKIFERSAKVAVFAIFLAVFYFLRRSIVTVFRDYTVWVLVGVGVLIVLLLLYLFVFLRGRKKAPAAVAPPEAEPAAGEAPVADAPGPAPAAAATEIQEVKSKLSSLRLRKIFARAHRFMRANVSGRGYRYQIPWVLMMGEAGSGKTRTLAEGGLKMPLGGPVGGRTGERHEVKFWFFEKGIVLDVAGDLVLRSDGHSSDEKLWALLLRLLQKYRPERPIDSIVLAIPAGDLLASGDSGAFDSDTIARKADLLGKKLRQAQKILGIRFSVYILVTQCDRIEGFQNYCRSLPEHRSHDMFGWSSPYTVDTGYASEWLGRAFDSLNQDLFQSQMEMLSQGVRLDEGDGVFLLRQHIAHLQDPLQIYLDRLFFESVYHDAYVLRGLYLCGASGLDAIQNVPSRAFFVRDVFNFKIFSEFRLARPLTRALITKNRKVLAAQIAALLLLITGVLGLWRTHVRLQDDKRAMLPVFEQIDADIKKLRRAGAPQDGLQLYQALRQGPVAISFDKSALNLFRGMTNFRRLNYLFIPSSWFSDIHERLRQAMVHAYDEIILKAMYIQLLQKAKTIFDTAGQDLPPPVFTGEVESVRDQPEFQELSTFVKNLKELETYADLYNGLRTTQNLEDIGQVAKYLFDIELPTAFYRNAKYYHSAIGGAEYRVFDPSIFKLKARFFTVRKLTRGLYARLFNPNVVEVKLSRLAERLEAFGRQRHRPQREMRVIRAVLETIGETETLLARDELAWVFKPAFDLGPEFDEILAAIESSSFLGIDPKQEALDEGGRLFGDLQAALRGKRSLLTGGVLALAGEVADDRIADVLQVGQDLVAAPAAADNEAFFADFAGEGIVDINEPDTAIGEEAETPEEVVEAESLLAGGEGDQGLPALTNRLSPRVTALKQELEGLLGQRFMAADGGVPSSLEMPPNSRMRWNRELLGDAVKLFDPYEVYQQEGLQKFPVDLQSSMAALARQNIERKVVDLIGRAQSFEPLPVDFSGQLKEADMLVEIRDFSKSAPVMQRLLVECDRFDLVQANQMLSDLLYWQTATLLDSFDQMYAEENLYGVQDGDLNWWDGRGALAFAAFEVEDEKELKNYLRFQRQRIRHMAETYARPLVTFLQGTRLLRHRQEERILFKWERVLTELEKYDAKKPKNSIVALEQFILSDLDKIRPDNYFEQVNDKTLRERSGDIFLQRRNALRRMAYRRCQLLAAGQVEKDYANFATFFNDKLAGRFPFSAAGRTSYRKEAEPEDIRDFFRLFDRSAGHLQDVLGANDRFGLSGDRAQDFITQLLGVQRFFQAYLGPPAGAGDAKADGKDDAKDVAKAVPIEEVPTFDMEVDFRVNREREHMANRIIDWQMTVGGQGLSQSARWRFGDPITLVLRWAKNAPDFPVFAGDRPEVKIDGRSVVYQFDNHWSLLRLLRDYAGEPADFEKLQDPKPHTLRFAIDTRRLGVRPEEGGEFQTRAYIRVGVLTPDKDKTAQVLPPFPDRAPALVRIADD